MNRVFFSHSNEVQEKLRNGPWVVIALVLLGIVAANLTTARYSRQAPSTSEARLLFEGKVLASFNTPAAKEIKEGMKATVTIDGYPDKKFGGTVILTHRNEPSETLLMIRLAEPPADASPPVPCQVTVDTSIGPGMLKSD